MQEPPPRIVIVDDDPELTEMLREYFERRPGGVSYTVEVAHTGPDGLAVLRRSRPDLVILDLHMPGMSGLEVLRQIRGIDTRIPVIMLTANEEVSLAAESLKQGVVSYFPKPVNLQYLESLVAVSLSTGRRRSML